MDFFIRILAWIIIVPVVGMGCTVFAAMIVSGFRPESFEESVNRRGVKPLTIALFILFWCLMAWT